MAHYLSTAALHWLAEQLAGESVAVSLHTASPGNSGTANEVSSAGGSNYARFTIDAANLTVDDGSSTVKNAAAVTIYTPNAAAAGVVVTHLGYWRDPTGDNEFFAWADLSQSVTTVENVPFEIRASRLGFTVSRS